MPMAATKKVSLLPSEERVARLDHLSPEAAGRRLGLQPSSVRTIRATIRRKTLGRKPRAIEPPITLVDALKAFETRDAMTLVDLATLLNRTTQTAATVTRTLVRLGYVQYLGSRGPARVYAITKKGAKLTERQRDELLLLDQDGQPRARMPHHGYDADAARILAEEPNIRTRQLAARLGCAPSSVLGILERLKPRRGK